MLYVLLYFLQSKILKVKKKNHTKGITLMGFPDGSVGKESTCNAGDTGDAGSIPRVGRSPGGGYGNPLQ